MDSSGGSSQPDPLPRKPKLPIVCRLKRLNWWIIIGAFALVGFMWHAPFIPDPQFPSGRNWGLAFLTWPVGLATGLGAIWGASDLLRAEIRGDETGLSWRRGFGGWKSARWEEITDFHQKYASSESWRVVETPSGNLSLDSSFERINDIAALIAERAINAPRSGWELKTPGRGQRWPVTLSPWSYEQKWGTPGFTILILGSGLYLGITFLINRKASQTFVGFWLDIFPLILGSTLAIPLMHIYAWMLKEMWQNRKFGWEHRDEKLVLNLEGLVFTSHANHIEANWIDVIGVKRLPQVKSVTPVQIETTQGHFLIWHGTGMGMWQKVQRLLRYQAPHILAEYHAQTHAKYRQITDLEGERGSWSGGAVGVGARRWSYQSRDTRFFFACATALSPFVPLFYLILVYMPAISDDVPPAPSWPLFSVLCLFCALVITMGWLWYRRAEILVDEDGVEVRSPFRGVQRADWNSIEGIDNNTFGEFLKVGKQRIYFVHFFPPVRVEELREAIERNITSLPKK